MKQNVCVNTLQLDTRTLLPYAAALKVEQFCEGFFTRLRKEPITFIYKSGVFSTPHPHRVFHFTTAGGAIFQYGVSEHLSTLAYFQQCAQIISRLREQGCAYNSLQEINLSAPTLTQPLPYQLEYHVVSAPTVENDMQLPRCLYFGCNEEFVATLPCHEKPKQAHYFRMQAAAELYIDTRTPPFREIFEHQVSAGIETSIPLHTLTLSSAVIRTDRRASLTIASIEPSCSSFILKTTVHDWIEKESLVMDTAEKSSANSQLNLGISMGSIELPLDTLLNLRPGMDLKLELPKDLTVQLSLGGALWGEAKLTVIDDQPNLQLTRILALED
jgi:hypothetical protein